jgi:hypothetical protein
MKMLKQLGEQLLAWTIIVIVGAVVLLVLELLRL